MTPLIWSILLIVLGLALVVLEMFLPSGGVLGFLASLAVLAAIVLAYYYNGPMVGTVFLATAGVVLPAVIAVALHWWPYTPLGRRIVIHPPSSEEEVLPDTENSRRLKGLIGKRGIAKSPMLPSGAIMIDRRIYDAVSEGVAIEQGAAVWVVQVEGNHVIVRPDDAGEPPPQEDDDILSRPIDTLGLDPLDDPLA